ncbi:MAG: nicotinate (nicotinamide) nucleotide adenylyltransferase [Arcobacteraceae bacterium]|nr:nicotinate (nicotinamide) nucleotide adenylyltransferase [Arcobacteraceae bacterium]
MKIAIFGGSFDPPHIGHEKIIELLFQSLDIDYIVVVPTYLSPFKKKSFLKPHDRLDLINLLFSDNKKIIVSDYEVNCGFAVPTINTVKYLSSKYDLTKIYLVIGDDHLDTLHLWDSYKELKNLVEFVVINRHNKQTIYKSLPLNIDISSSKLRQELDLDYIPTKIKEEVTKYWKKEYKK